MSLTSLYHTGPVTALLCHGDKILAGIGSYLRIFSSSQQKCVHSCMTLPGSNIHGITADTLDTDNKSTCRYCVFGGKSLRVVKCDFTTNEICHVTGVLEVEDWIWAVTWLQKEDDENFRCLALALGHNVIVKIGLLKEDTVDLKKGHLKGMQLEKYDCQEKCILYCAKFLSRTWSHLVLAAGTVFNQVVIWSPHSARNEAGQCGVLHRLTGHQGVVFSIDYSPEHQRICSVSDDRSIRLWQLSFPVASHSQTLTDWDVVESHLLQVLYGHSARVWDVRLMADMFVSIGEDATCCVWDYAGEVIQKFKGHKGRSIWSLDCDSDGHFVVTGGGDSSVRLWNLDSVRRGCENDSNVPSTTRQLNLQLQVGDFPRSVQMLDYNTMLIMTNEGHLMSYISDKNSSQCLMSDAEFQSYTFMIVSEEAQIISLGNISGTLRLLFKADPTKTEFDRYDVKLYDGKIFSIVWLAQDSLLTTGPDGVVDLLIIRTSDGLLRVTKYSRLFLPPSKHRWISAAALAPGGSTVVCGDRTGSVLLYSIEDSSETCKPVQTFSKIHGKTGVTDIRCHGNQVYTAGRDGHYRVYSWEDEQLVLLSSNKVFKGLDWIDKIQFTVEGDMTIYGFQSNKFILWSVGQNEKLLEVPCGGGHRAWDMKMYKNTAHFMYLKTREVVLHECNLKSSQYVLKDGLHGREMCDIKFLSTYFDNAGHPAFLLLTCSEDTSICLSELKYNDSNIPELNTLHTLQGHISSVRCLAVCQCGLSESSLNRKLVFSGGGRAQLRVWKVECSKPEAKNLELRTQECASHVNSEPILKENGQNCEKGQQSHYHSKHSVNAQIYNTKSSTEGRCHDTDSSSTAVHCKCESLCNLQLGNRGARKSRKPWKYRELHYDPETRILDLAAFCAIEIDPNFPSWLYFLSAACSDAFVRVFAFDEQSRELSPITSSSFHDHCVLKVCCLTHNAINRKWALMVSAGTDGRVAFWDITKFCTNFVTQLIRHSKETDSETVQDVPKYSSGHEEQILNTKQFEQPVEVKFLEKCTEKLPSASFSVCGQKDNVVHSKADNSSEARKDNSTLSGTVGAPGHSSCGAESLGEEDTMNELSPFFVETCHQSGVNSLHLLRARGDHYLLATGGDDNALKVARLQISESKEHRGQLQVKVMSRGQHLSAHSAQITGIYCLTTTEIITVSIDQRVCWWHLMDRDNGTDINLTSCKFVNVADIANMDVWSDRTSTRLAVCGQGLQILNLSLNSHADNDDDKCKTQLLHL